MRNFVQPGDTLTLIAPNAVASGAGFQIGGIFAVAKSAAAQGAPVEGKRTGVIDLAKQTGQAWVQGQPLYWDNSNMVLTTTSGSNKLVGAAAQAHAAADTVGRALLTGQVG